MYTASPAQAGHSRTLVHDPYRLRVGALISFHHFAQRIMTTPKRKGGFDLKTASTAAKTKQVKTTQVPKASQIQTSEDAVSSCQANQNVGTFKGLKPLRMPEEVLSRLRNATAVLGFDIESHDELPKIPAYSGH